jgi:protease I
MTKIPNDTFVAPQTDAADKAVLILTADKVQDLEFFYPYYRFIEDGFKVDVVTPDGGELKCKNSMGIKETKKIEDVDINDYDMLYIPGGKAPQELKKNEGVLELVKSFAATGRPIAAICHGPQVLAAADLISGYNISAWPEVEDEINDAGATYLGKETVIDGQFITARWPGDLPSHLIHALEALDSYSGTNKKTNRS